MNTFRYYQAGFMIAISIVVTITHLIWLGISLANSRTYEIVSSFFFLVVFLTVVIGTLLKWMDE